jgi:hypothetical protein
MTIEQIRSVYQTRPFRPFVMHLVDGRQFTVRHPEFVVFSSDGRSLAVHQDDDTAAVIDPSTVVELEVKSNVVGTGKRPKN